jgi:hypothetical protein
LRLDWETKVRLRAFNLWEQEQRHEVAASELWERALAMERSNPGPLELSEDLRKHLSPSDSRWVCWLKKSLSIGQTNWAATLEEVDRRRLVFALHKSQLDDVENAKHEIASVDIFVEKAQHLLEVKSKQCLILAFGSAVFLAGIIVLDWIWLSRYSTLPNFLETLRSVGFHDLNGYIFAMWVLRGAALSALSAALIYFFGSLARAFLHEATILWNRRHSLRLGRLFVYLKFAGVGREQLSKVREQLTIEDIERAFGWNLESSSAFRDMKPELMTRGSLADPARVIEAAAKLVAEVSKKREQQSA